MNVTFTQTNPRTGDATIYLDRMTSLDLGLTHDEAPIPIQSGNNASTLKIYLPNFFSPDDLNIMTIDQADWEFSSYIDENNINNCYLSLEYTGNGYDWNEGETLTFTIERVWVGQTTKELPYQNQSQISFENFGNLSAFTPYVADLTLDNPPPAQADLKEVLQVFLSYEGLIHVSSDEEKDPLQNTLYLNFNNMGDAPLSTSSQARGEVQVSFVYGDTSGALTSLDNALNIKAGVANQEGNAWTATDPGTATTNDPIWTLSPDEAEVIGTGENANVVFDFSNIISSASPGDTQMIVSFSGFMKDDDTPYDDATYVLDIKKLETPRLRGLTSFSVDSGGAAAATTAAALRYEIATPQDVINVPLYWGMYYVDKVQIVTSLPDNSPVPFPTANSSYSEAIGTDSTSLRLTGIEYSGNISITAQAFDGTGALLNSIELTIFVQSSYIPDLVRPNLILFNQEMSGLLRFYCPYVKPVLGIGSDSVNLTLVFWTHGVDNIALYTKHSSPTPSVIHDCLDTTLRQPANHCSVEIPVVNTDPITIIAMARDAGNHVLNSMECTLFPYIPYIDQAGKHYPTVRIGSQLWMTENLDWDSGDCISYPDDDSYAKDNKLGKLYNPTDLLSPNAGATYPAIQPGWRLPGPSNWQNLFDAFGRISPYPYDALINGGASGLNLQLGGCFNGGAVLDKGIYGYYATADSPATYGIINSIGYGEYSNAASVSYNNYPGLVSVRFVKDIME